jgi:hypothetical protein
MPRTPQTTRPVPGAPVQLGGADEGTAEELEAGAEVRPGVEADAVQGTIGAPHAADHLAGAIPRAGAAGGADEGTAEELEAGAEVRPRVEPDGIEGTIGAPHAAGHLAGAIPRTGAAGAVGDDAPKELELAPRGDRVTQQVQAYYGHAHADRPSVWHRLSS